MRKIAVVTGSRAEYGLLRETLRLLHQAPDIDLQLIVTGTHLSEAHGMTVSEIEADGFNIFSRADLQLTPEKEAPAITMGFALSKIAYDLAQLCPDMVLLIGDRYEMAAAAMAAAMLRIPIAHIGGGERTDGAIDDSLRHAITKLSYWHLVSTPRYRDNVVKMGEDARNVFLVGAPGVDGLTSLLGWNYCAELINIDKVWETPPKVAKLILFSWHPETLGNSNLTEVLAALDAIKDATIIMTGANADEGGNLINQQLREYASTREGVLFRKSFPHQVYLSLMLYADVMMGNSSAGVIEAPTLGTPSLNIGTRQEGRYMPPSVTSVPAASASIAMALNLKLSNEKKAVMPTTVFGVPGEIAPAIFSVLSSVGIPLLPIKRLYA